MSKTFQIKKPSLKKMMLTNILITLAIVTFAAIAGLAIVNHTYKSDNVSHVMDDADDQFSDINTYYDDAIEKQGYVNKNILADWEPMDDVISKVHLRQSIGAEFKDSYMTTTTVGNIDIFDEDKNPIGVNGEKYAFVIIRDRDETRNPDNHAVFFETPITDDLIAADKLTYSENASIVIDDCYVSGHTFYPGHISVQKVDGSIIWENDPTQVEAYTQKVDGTIVWEDDLTPADKDNYTHLIFDENWTCIPVIDAFPKKPAIIQENINQAVADLEPYDEPGDNGIWAYSYTESPSRGNATKVEGITLSDGTKIIVAYSAHYDLFYSLVDKIIAAVVIVLAYLIALVIVIIFTISKYHKEKNIYEMDQYRKNLTDIMAHDLKTPLMAIAGYAENISEDIHPEKREQYIKEIRENTKNMNQMINDILELSKADQGISKSSMKETDLVDMSEKIIENYQVLLDKKGMKTSISGEMKVKAHPTYMQQAIDNIIANAIKYGDEGSTIEIICADKKMIVTNAYSGTLDVEVKELTEAFVKGEKSRSRKDGAANSGTGVGLSISKTMLMQQGYSLSLNHHDGEFIVNIMF